MADDPLRLSPEWGHRVEDGTDLAPLLAFDQALELSSLRRGINRDAFLKDLLSDLHHQQLIPLLLMLPRRWKLRQANLPDHLRTIGGLLETGLISPLLLATLADDLQHLLPTSPKRQQRRAIDRWSERQVALNDHRTVPLPESLDELETILATDLAGPVETSKPSGTLTKISALGNTLCWRNEGLSSLQSERARQRNRVMAQVLNALGSNRLPSMPGGSTPFQFCGISSGRALLQQLRARGWQCRGRIRASVASFGLGASTHNSDHWQQVPLAVPYRTGLLDADGEEIRALLPHCSLEMELKPPSPEADTVLLQYYQGTEGLNGWAALNDQHRPWQNDRNNGTVAYPTGELHDQSLEEALDLCELMGAVHNSEAQLSDLHGGGYGALGFCIDSTALVELAITGTTSLFPLTLGDLWRQRLLHQLQQLLDAGLQAPEHCVGRYRNSLEQLPQDLFHSNASRSDAQRRLRLSQPRHSPFALVRALNGETSKMT
tara:strand:+ start:1014 stop:2486 length:1473 start_codon:yes stop_codon:yes gene_type:complete